MGARQSWYNEDMKTVTLSQAKSLIRCLAHEQSLLLLSPPGVGKSETVLQAASEADLPCRSLLGTQIAPEDVSGIPRLVGERSIFCPPRILLPEPPQPFCLFLDELPACAPEIQKAFYSLLLERRLGEHHLPKGTWVVSAGNRLEDKALVRALSSALINRVTILQIRVDVQEWLTWAEQHQLREDVRTFIRFVPEALMRTVPDTPTPFSTPRAWTSLAKALNQAEQDGLLTSDVRRSLTFGHVSPADAALYCAMAEDRITNLLPLNEYIQHPERIPTADTARWFVLSRIRTAVGRHQLRDIAPESINAFLLAIPEEHRFALLVDQIEEWADLGAEAAMLQTLKEVTGL